jgi:hypothetical protein
VDRVPKEIPPAFWQPHELIPVEDLRLENFAEMVQNYDVVELNTAVKPFYMEYLYRRNPEVEAVYYLDPDIMVFAPFKPLEERLRSNNIVVTPHSCTHENTETTVYYETGMLSTGVYNLGFLGTSRSEVTITFLQWWQHRLRTHCYYRPGTGIFVDQLWMTLAPLYFPVHVDKNPGFNMCYWNHFERQLSQNDGRYFVNGDQPLVFYHFSSYSPEIPDRVTKRAKSKIVSFAERPDLKLIYDEYRIRLLANGYESVKSIRYALRQNPPKTKLTAKAAVRSILRSLPSPLQTVLKSGAQFVQNTFK